MADNKYKLQFTLSNGETINAGEIVAPQGPKGDKGDSADIPYSSSTPFMDGVGSVGSANTVARGDHRHPSDTSRQEKLVSGTNIKTINGQSVLGSGDIQISGGGTIDANTLIALLLGSNGISIAKNTAGDKVEVKLAIPETGPISLTNNNAPRPAIDITIPVGGPPASGGIVISSSGSPEQSARLGPSQLRLVSGSSELTVSPSGIISWYNSSEVGHGLISGGPKGNVKTLFGNQQSIYGSGNIDLYRHTVWFTAVSGSSTIVDCVLTVISSSNVAIDSLTDLFSVVKPMVSSGGTYPANGRVYNTSNNKYYTITRIYPTSDGAMIGNTQDEEKWFSWTTPGTWAFQDKVTTV